MIHGLPIMTQPSVDRITVNTRAVREGIDLNETWRSTRQRVVVVDFSTPAAAVDFDINPSLAGLYSTAVDVTIVQR